MKIKYIIILYVLLIVKVTAQIYSENESIVPEIKKGNFDKELVEIEGVVEFWERVPQKTTIRYWLRDYWGKLIPVQSVIEHPIVNQKYKIKGTVQISSRRLRYNNTSTKRFIDEHSREEIKLVEETSSNGKEEEVEQKPSESELLLTDVLTEYNNVASTWYYDYSKVKQLIAEAKFNMSDGNETIANQKLIAAQGIIANPPFSRLFYLAIILIILIIAIIVSLFILLTGKSKNSSSIQPSPPLHREFDQSKLTVKTPEPEQTIGETIKLSVPPQGTLKVLKGRMEIVDGETELKEIRFYSLPNQNSNEFSFGRNTGAPYQHIQISHPTVSRDQARLLYSNGTYTIINKADPVSKNATKLNGIDIPLNESRTLKDGDKISMGVITMIYRDI